MTGVNPQHIIDSVTLRVAKTLLENPEIAYTKTSLAKQSNVSRDAIYRRLETYRRKGLIKEAEVESENDHYKLNTGSQLTENLGQILYHVFEVEEE